MHLRAHMLIVAALAMLISVAGTAFGQTRPAAILEYFDDELELQVLDADNFEYNNIFMGMELLPGDTVRTFSSTVELRLEPNGSIIKLSPDTEFTIESLNGRDDAATNSFALSTGKLRAVAARASGTAYRFRTPAAVGGVRGTDFGIEVVPEEREALFVREGSVAFERTATNQQVMVRAGQLADVFADTFEPLNVDPETMAGLFENLDFEELDPDRVPQARSAGRDEADDGQDEDADDDEDAGDGADDGADGATTETDAAPADEEPTAFDRTMTRLGEVMGLETGALTLDGETYAKIVVQPSISVGKLKAALYLPAVYQNNLFDPGTYYRPKGNNEWSFGSDQDWENEPLAATGDLFTDLALKLRYLQYGEQRDPLYLKLGNLDNMTLGHGLLMRDYANDVDFPAVRRIGLNGGIDTGGFGFETAVNDLTEPEIFGGRIFLRPLQRTAALGFSAVADIDPAGDIPKDDPEYPSALADELRRVDPIVTAVGADVDVSIVENDLLSVVAFTDVGGLVPYLRDSLTDIDGNEVDAGLKTEAFVDTDAGRLRNFGAMTGVLGDIAFFDYRADFRTYNGLFRPFYFDSGYERRRGRVAEDIYRYFVDPSADEFNETGAGVYGEAGVSLFADNLHFRAGYLWPWKVDSAGEWTLSDYDYLTLRAELREGLLPLGIHASAEYDRRGFFATAMSRGEFSEATFFDANSVLRSEVVYPVAPTLDLALIVTTTVLRNEDGTIRYDDGEPEVGNSVTIETRIGL
ncbi:MAG: FecR family protein [Spirochaetia bacterium]